MKIQSIVAGAAIAKIADVGSVTANEITMDRTAVNTGTLYMQMPARVAVPMIEAELDAVRGHWIDNRDITPRYKVWNYCDSIGHTPALSLGVGR